MRFCARVVKGCAIQLLIKQQYVLRQRTASKSH